MEIFMDESPWIMPHREIYPAIMVSRLDRCAGQAIGVAVFVRVVHCRTVPGQEPAFIRSGQEWRETHAPGLPAVDLRPAIHNPSDLVLLARVESPEAAIRNALGTRRQTRRRRWAGLLEAVPRLTDTESL
jgi:hypothetical protein